MGQAPATLEAAIATQPAWLQAWVGVLILVHVLALAFVVHRAPEGWRIRWEPLAIFASFVAAGLLMSWMYTQVGYVRLLGLAHLIFWSPAYAWVVVRRPAIGARTLFGKYVVAYLVIAGISLVIDAIDVVRYMASI